MGSCTRIHGVDLCQVPGYDWGGDLWLCSYSYFEHMKPDKQSVLLIFSILPKVQNVKGYMSDMEPRTRIRDVNCKEP